MNLERMAPFSTVVFRTLEKDVDARLAAPLAFPSKILQKKPPCLRWFNLKNTHFRMLSAGNFHLWPKNFLMFW